MPIPQSTTRWRGEPVLPQDYDDVWALVSTAREARYQEVDFDWAFTEEGLRALQRAVLEWGTRVNGRFRRFDARVLSAVQQALGEPVTAFYLSEPKTASGAGFLVLGSREGDLFRLSGHASFDVVFGYGRAAVGLPFPESVYLDESARSTLAEVVGMLGWDLARLNQDQYRPAINALFGLPPSYGDPKLDAASEPERSVALDFRGPFSAGEDPGAPSLFAQEISGSAGIYLWTLPFAGLHRVTYVGQTRRTFGQRISEHFAGILSGQYSVYDLDELRRGRWSVAKGSAQGCWPDTLPAFLDHYDLLAPSILRFIRQLRFHVSPLDGDRHLYDRVEGAIGRHLKTHQDDAVRSAIGPGLKVPAMVPGDFPVRITIASDVPLPGLPEVLKEP
jgi:hypothetical protein